MKRGLWLRPETRPGTRVLPWDGPVDPGPQIGGFLHSLIIIVQMIDIETCILIGLDFVPSSESQRHQQVCRSGFSADSAGLRLD